MRIFNGFEELKAAVGTEVGVSDWIEVTQRRINTRSAPVKGARAHGVVLEQLRMVVVR